MTGLSGLLLLSKPPGPTSHDAVLWVRRALNTSRVGHCGTLDPLATGLLLLGVGEVLKMQDRLVSLKKTYRGKFLLGSSTDTDDISGKTLPIRWSRTPQEVTSQEIKTLLKAFEGTQVQKVPRFCAVKVGGRRLYEWAREGVEMDLPQKTVMISHIEFLSFSVPYVEFTVTCSKGTYVRSLARDLGEKLGTGATLAELSREQVGPFQVKEAYHWQKEVPMNPLHLRKILIPLGDIRRLLHVPA